MKKLCFLTVIFASYYATIAQNVGIGTNTPTYPLTVVAKDSKGIVQKDGTVEVGFYTSIQGSAFVQTWSNHPLYFATNNGVPQMTLLTNGNFGIGFQQPSSKLYVEGNSSLMGSVGINTSSPTSLLDINGDIRIRGSVPKKGSVLTSTDANGNATWQDPVAFRVGGLLNNLYANIPLNTWSKINFASTTTYNLGVNYQPATSQFVAAEKGIYNLKTNLIYDDDNIMFKSYVRFLLNRSGNLSELARTAKYSDERSNANETVYVDGNVHLTLDLQLEAGDIVTVEAWVEYIVLRSPFPRTSLAYAQLRPFANETWFSGHLIARL